MKTRPFIKSTAFILVILAAIFVVRCKTSQKVQTSEVGAFLNAFNKSLQTGNTDSVLRYFDAGKQRPAFKRMANLLLGKQDFSAPTKLLAAISLDMDAATVNVTGEEQAVAKIPASFSHDSISNKKSVLSITIHKVQSHQYKIAMVDARQFLTDYVAYENLVKSKTLTEADLFSPETLAAFKTAEALKPTYDTVVWFAHVDKKTFFYVVKGKWDADIDLFHYKDTVVEPIKMGLVGPDLKEVIAPQYDLIHSISATFPGLVEVEKDGKKGFYDLTGKIVLPVDYDQVLPIVGDANLAILRKGDDFFYLKPDMSVSEKTDIKFNAFFSKIKGLAGAIDLYKTAAGIVTEYNSRTQNGAVYIAPSYLVEMNVVAKAIDFENPLRKAQEDEVHKSYQVKYTGTVKPADNWLEASFYSIRDYFLGGRSEFYDKKNMVVVDKKNNRVFAQELQVDYSTEEGGGVLASACDVNAIKVINDSLYEVKSGAVLNIELYDSTQYIESGSYYHYFKVKNNKMTELPNNRFFGFTKYVKMDDSYLEGCYSMILGTGSYNTRQKKTINHVTPEILRFIKNEIYAGYRYQFKDKRWGYLFSETPAYYNNGKQQPNNANVDDSLTIIDKYNINWIAQKLKSAKTPKNTIAAR
jgi:hypothetical protein